MNTWPVSCLKGDFDYNCYVFRYFLLFFSYVICIMSVFISLYFDRDDVEGNMETHICVSCGSPPRLI